MSEPVGAAPMDLETLSDEYRSGWFQGAQAVLRELMTRDLGGFLSGPKKNGIAEEWIAVGDIFAVIADVKDKPETPNAKR